MAVELKQTKKQTNETEGKIASRPPLLRRQSSMRQQAQATSALGPKALLLTLTLGLALAGRCSRDSNDITEFDASAAFGRCMDATSSPVGAGYERMLIRDNGSLKQNIKKLDFDGWYLNYEWSTTGVTEANLFGGEWSGVVENSRLMYDLCTPEMQEYLRSANINGVITFLKLKHENKGFSVDARRTIDAIIKGMERDCARDNLVFNRTGYQGTSLEPGFALANNVDLRSVLPQLYDAPAAAVAVAPAVAPAAPQRDFVWEYNSRNGKDLWEAGSATRAKWTAYSEEDQRTLEEALKMSMSDSVDGDTGVRMNARVVDNRFRVIKQTDRDCAPAVQLGGFAYEQAQYGASLDTDFEFVQVGGLDMLNNIITALVSGDSFDTTYRPVRRRFL